MIGPHDTIGEWRASYWRNIGHTHITHSHLLKMEDTLLCSLCKVPLSAKHILLNCDSFRQNRPKYYQTSNLKDLFKITKPEDILNLKKNNQPFC